MDHDQSIYCQSGRWVGNFNGDIGPCAEFGIETWMIADVAQPGRRLMFGLCRRHDVDFWQRANQAPQGRYFFARLMGIEGHA